MNVMYFLSQSASVNKSVIDQGCKYLIEEQNEQGFWDCDWSYIPPYTSIYLAARNYENGISCMQPTREKMIGYLVKTQKQDGGWGRSEISNSLDTSLATLTLDYLNGPRERIDRGKEFLLRAQQTDGGWESVYFFTQTPKNNDVLFSSRALTTAFAIRALSE